MKQNGTLRASLFLTLLSVCLSFAAPQSRTSSIAGNVTKAGTNEPLANVLIQLADRTAFTDSNGRFELNALPPGTFGLAARLDGYVILGKHMGHVLFAADMGMVTIEPQQVVTNAHFEMVPEAIISGRLMSPSGTPVPNAVMRLLRVSYVDGRRSLTTADSAVPVISNDRGNYRMPGLPPGEYYVIADPRGAFSGDRPLGPTLHPAAPDPGRATPILLKNGQAADRVDFVLQEDNPLFAFHGHAVMEVPFTPTGQRTLMSFRLVPREEALTVPHSFGATYNSNPGDPGRFFFPPTFGRFLFAPGLYDLVAEVPGGVPQLSGSIPVRLGFEPLSELRVPLRSGTDVKGNTIIRGDASKVKLPRVPLLLRSVTNMAYSTVRHQNELLADNSFVIKSVFEGRYRVIPSHPAGMYIADVQQNGNSVLASEIIVGSASPNSIEVILDTNGGTIEGVLQSGRGQVMSLFPIVLVPSSPRRGEYLRYRTVTTDIRGRFVFNDVAPGDYKVFSWSSPSENAWTNSEFLLPYEDRGVSVRVSPAGRVASVAVSLIAD